MGKYRVLPQNEYARDEYALVPMREVDIFDIQQWRNDQVEVLRQMVLLTDRDQQEYYQQYVVPSFSEARPGIILFSYLNNGGCIGYGGLTNIDWVNRHAEVSFLLQTERAGDVLQYRRDFTNFLHLMKHVAFTELQLNRIFTETFDIRPDHCSILEENGFVPEGRLKQHVIRRGEFVDSLIHGFVREQYHG